MFRFVPWYHSSKQNKLKRDVLNILHFRLHVNGQHKFGKTKNQVKRLRGKVGL